MLKVEGAYHGANEIGTVSLFPRRLLNFPAAEPTSAGLGPGAVADILVAPYNDLDMTGRIVEAHRHELAAIVVEPLHRCTPPRPGFLQGLREIATEIGALLVFDEVVTDIGFRYVFTTESGLGYEAFRVALNELLRIADEIIVPMYNRYR